MNNYEIWRELSGKLSGYLIVHVKDEEVAKDILQDVFLNILDIEKGRSLANLS